MALNYWITFSKIHSQKFGDVSERQTKIFDIPYSVNLLNYLKEFLKSDILIHNVQRIFKKDLP